MADFDLEDYRDLMKAFLVDNMAAKVSEINAIKSDSLTLIEIPEAQYFQDFNGIVNFNDFIYWGFLPFEEGVSNANALAQPVSMFFLTMISDQEGGIVGENKILRYTRAMKEIFQAQALTDSRISGLELSIMAPDIVQIKPGADWYKAGGVYVKGTVVL